MRRPSLCSSSRFRCASRRLAWPTRSTGLGLQFLRFVLGLSNASGQIRLRGELDPVNGTTSGDYLGTIRTQN
jgi:hypothetical protein